MNTKRLAIIVLIVGILSIAIGIYIYVFYSNQSIHLRTSDCILRDKTLCQDQATIQSIIPIIPLTILGAWGGFLIIVSFFLRTKPAQNN